MRVCDGCFTQLCEGRTSFFENQAAVAELKSQTEGAVPPERPARRAPPRPANPDGENKQDADNGNSADANSADLSDSDDEPSINSDDPVEALEDGLDNLAIDKVSYFLR